MHISTESSLLIFRLLNSEEKKMNSKLSGLLSTCVLIPGIIASALPVKPVWAGGAYGADTCRSGYVWREVVRGDRVCVTPRTRSQAAYDNSQASARRKSGSVPIDPGTNLNPVRD